LVAVTAVGGNSEKTAGVLEGDWVGVGVRELVHVGVRVGEGVSHIKGPLAVTKT